MRQLCGAPRVDISEELTMAKSIVAIAILALCTSTALAAHRTHHRQSMNASAAAGASPVAPPGVSSSDHAMYLKNLRDSGYNPKNDFNKTGLLVNQ
jgi:hypothetical protein